MKLEVGKIYVCRNGEVVGPLGFVDGRIYPFRCPSYKYTWTEEGIYDMENPGCPLDIVSEYIEPQQELRWRWMKPDRPGVWAWGGSRKEKRMCNEVRNVHIGPEDDGVLSLNDIYVAGWWCFICEMPEILPPERVIVMKRLYVRVLGMPPEENIETRWFNEGSEPSPDEWARTDLVQEFTE